ncbi:hypothetical protein AAFF_G00072630 [Aldrovandia affinis]|uniref:Uncharacterized protein n=1 Tax=Aldrovandia affinis TaxID=143900 RepID=A0AAD7RYT6_9TELE|nr:hypothetical protein AAFF_G00072630 [Aldrovandia affinis]
MLFLQERLGRTQRLTPRRFLSRCGNSPPLPLRFARGRVVFQGPSTEEQVGVRGEGRSTGASETARVYIEPRVQV